MINGWKGFEFILFKKKEKNKVIFNVFDFNKGIWLVVHYYCLSRMRKIICFPSISFGSFEMMFSVLILKPFDPVKILHFELSMLYQKWLLSPHPPESHLQSTIHCGLLSYICLILLIVFPFRQPIDSWSSLSFKHNEW